MKVPFRCPDCSTSGSLTITHRLELPPDASWDEIALQIVRCSRCGFSGLAVYQESRRGALDSEIIHHSGFYIDDAELKSILGMIQKCPKPKNEKCNCSAHRKLGRKDGYGGWDGLNEIQLGRHFEMKLD